LKKGMPPTLAIWITTRLEDMMRVRTRPPVHPGSIIKQHYLDPLAITIAQAAATLGISRKTLSKIINGHGAVTPDMALRLSTAFRTTPELWLNLQRNYDLWHAAHQSDAWREVPALVPAE
jgi:addiction module HigA family antidote